jgi:hypothetical protein
MLAHIRRRLTLALIPACTLLVGCEEARVPVFPVSGRVTYKGKPAAGAQIMLNAVNQLQGDDIAPIGVVKGDGTFAITAYDPGDGAPEGEYVVTVQWFKLVTGAGGSGAGPNILPPKYASPLTSPVKVSVKGGPTEVPPIALN